MEKEVFIMVVIGIIIFSLTIIKLGLQVNMQNEYIKLLEQSLVEQIQEKQVYINMLEGRNE